MDKQTDRQTDKQTELVKQNCALHALHADVHIQFNQYLHT